MTDDKSADSTNATKTYTEQDVQKARETEKAHADHFKKLYEEASGKLKGYDPEKYNAAIAEAEELRKKNAKTPEEIDALIKRTRDDAEAEINRRYKGNLDEATQKALKLMSRLNSLEVETPIVKIGTEKGVNADMIDILTTLAARELGYDPETGKVFVKDEKGEPRYSRLDPSKAMTPDEWVEDLRVTKPSMFKSEFKPGAGTTNGNPNKSVNIGGMTVDKWQRLSPAERNAAPKDVQNAMDKQLLGLN